MEILVAQIIGGLMTGSIYALAAVSVTFLLLVAGFIQFAHGEVMVLAMYFTWLVLSITGESLLLGIFGALIGATLFTIVLEPLTRRLRQRNATIECLILSVAYGSILTEIMSHTFHHGMPVRFPAALRSGQIDFQIGLIYVSAANIYVVIGCILVLLLFSRFLYKTKQGKAMRAIAQDQEISRVLGLPIGRTTFLSFTITGFLGGVTAVLLAMALGFASPALGGVLSFKLLAVMLFAGMGNFAGAVVCGLLLGVIESLTTGYFLGAWTDAISMGIVMFTIMIRPNGLFGSKV